MINKIKQHKILVNISFFLVVVVVVIFFVAVPLVVQIKIQADEIQQKKMDSEINQSRLAKLPEMEKRHEIFANDQKNLEVIIGADQEVALIKKMESLADETGNKITLKISDETGKAQQKGDKADLKANLPYDNFIVMQLSLEGYYDSFLNFIHKLENLNNFVNITSISLVKAKVESQDNSGTTGNSGDTVAAGKEILKSSIEVVVYVKK